MLGTWLEQGCQFLGQGLHVSALNCRDDSVHPRLIEILVLYASAIYFRQWQ